MNMNGPPKSTNCTTSVNVGVVVPTDTAEQGEQGTEREREEGDEGRVPTMLTYASPSGLVVPLASRTRTHGAPTSSNGRVVPRPSEASVPSSSTVPG